MKTTLLAIALCSACYSPAYRDCEVTCASQTCPSGYSCESGFCVSTPGMSCSGVGSDGGTDSSIDAPAGAWSTPTPVEFVMGTPMSVDDDPTLPDDELQLFVNRLSGASGDIFFSRRSSTTVIWPSPGPLAELNSSLDEQTPELAADGLTIFFASNRSGGVGGLDIWTAQRTTPTAAFGVPMLAAPASSGINSNTDDHSPSISRDGLTLVFASQRAGDFDIYLTNRNSPTGTFGTPMPMTPINMAAAYDESPFMSANKLTIYFNSNRAGSHDLYQASRSSVTAAFGPPTPITELNDAQANEADPWVSNDGKRIYFTRAISGVLTLMQSSR
jgi:hypothetical protein